MAGNDSNTKILLHMDGANASTTFTDTNAGGSAHTWAANGNAQLSTTSPKFGTASGLFDGSGDTISTADHADFTLGSGAWTVDFWINAGGSSGRAGLCGQATTTFASMSFIIERQANNTIAAQVSDGSAAPGPVSTTTFADSAWHHIALVRTSNTLKLFIGGTQEGGDVTFSGTVNDSSQSFFVGQGYSSVADWNGKIDEFRLSVGTARWTTTFTPPTAPYGVDSTLTSAAGSYALTGVAAVLRAGKGIAAAAGSYALTGVAATLTYAQHFFRLTAAAGSYTLTGVTASLKKALRLTASAGSYLLTGVAATLKKALKLTAAAGSYVVTGIALVIAEAVAPISKFKLRRADFILQKLRITAPTLGD